MVKLMYGDCLERMKEIPDKSINMVLCDLPYAETGNKWDKGIDLKQLFDEYRRVITDDGCIALNGTMRFGFLLYSTAPDLYKYEWVWEKDHGTNVLSVHFQPFRVHEYIYIFSKGRAAPGKAQAMRYNPQMIEGKPYCLKAGKSNFKFHGKFNRDRGLHPTQKPVALLEYLIRTYTNEGDTVLDNTMGSGSTGVACKLTGRNFIGIEIDRDYFRIAKQRIKET